MQEAVINGWCRMALMIKRIIIIGLIFSAVISVMVYSDLYKGAG